MHLILLAIGATALAAGGGLWAAGEAIDEAGNGTLKIAGAAALGAGAYLAIKKWG